MSISGKTDPVVLRVKPADIAEALGQGLRDFQAMPLLGLMFGALYAIGGIKGDGSVSNALEVYDPATSLWSAYPSLPSARGALTAGIIENKLHVAGGATWKPLKTYSNHDVFDLSSKTWSNGPPLPTARQGSASAVAAGRWWVIGGGSGAGVFGGFTASDAVEAYEP